MFVELEISETIELFMQTWSLDVPFLVNLCCAGERTTCDCQNDLLKPGDVTLQGFLRPGGSGLVGTQLPNNIFPVGNVTDHSGSKLPGWRDKPYPKRFAECLG